MTRASHFIAAPPAAVYRALLDPAAVQHWKVPDGMTSEVHRFEPREGGAIRISLTYDATDRQGKTIGRTDTYAGRFLELVPGERVVEAVEFVTDDPFLRGEMTITTTLAEQPGGTEVSIEHEGLPAGVRPADNELGTKMSLEKLAALVEGDQSGSGTSWNVSA